jgi:carbamoyltransferase
MKLLALRLCEHDSNISYFDGSELHYYKSEREYQIKHHAFHNIWEWQDVIKRLWGVNESDIDEIAIVFDPWAYRLPINNETFFPAIEYNYIPSKCKVWRLNHHYAHALSSWMLLEKEPDVSIVIDGFGDFDKAWSVIKNNMLVEEGSLQKNGSIGQMLADAGRNLGVEADHGLDIAGKVMGLQSFGCIDEGYLNFIQQYDLYSINHLYDVNNWYLYKQDPLIANLTRLDWIKTIHARTGEILVDFFKKFASKDDVIHYSGGVAQNVVWNTELKKHFNNIIIPPHCSDDGLSLGAIEWLRIKNNLPKFKLNGFPFSQKDQAPITYPSQETIKKTALLLAEGKTVAWYQGNGELGPRALGNRSILMNPLINNGKIKINNIKRREQYRPFGASVLNEFKEEYFCLDYENPFMLFTSKLKNNNMECITHIDNTCRIQTVNENGSSFRLLLEEFYKVTGCPVLLNTSLNLAGKPIAGYIDNAKELFYGSNLDCLVIGNDLYEK